MNEGRSRATLHVVNSAYKYHRELIVVCVGVCRYMCVCMVTCVVISDISEGCMGSDCGVVVAN